MTPHGECEQPVLPNFFILGGVRCGTTSLYRYLQQHPDVFLPRVKEPEFFVYEGRENPRAGSSVVTRYEDYVALYAGANGESAIGDATPTYLYLSETVVPGIRRRVPEPRFVVSLRKPSERAHSQYRLAVREGKERCSTFEEALSLEEARIRDGAVPLFHYTRQSFYHEHLDRYAATFGRERMHVVLFDDFIADPVEVVEGILRFLGVDDCFVPHLTARYNATSGVRSRSVDRLVMRPNSLKSIMGVTLPPRVRRRMKAWAMRANTQRHRLLPGTRARLAELYQEDVRRVSDFLGRDLSHWLD